MVVYCENHELFLFCCVSEVKVSNMHVMKLIKNCHCFFLILCASIFVNACNLQYTRICNHFCNSCDMLYFLMPSAQWLFTLSIRLDFITVSRMEWLQQLICVLRYIYYIIDASYVVWYLKRCLQYKLNKLQLFSLIHCF